MDTRHATNTEKIILKQGWTTPEIVDLNAKQTEYGKGPTTTDDATDSATS